MKIKIIIITFLVILLNFNSYSQETNPDIKELNKLLESGIITEDEHSKLKKIITSKAYKKKNKDSVQSEKKKNKDSVQSEKKIIIKTDIAKEEQTQIITDLDTENNLEKSILSINKKKILFKRASNQTKKESKCVPKESKKASERVICIKKLDLKKLGTYMEFKAYPEGMLKVVNKGCTNWACTRKKAGKKVYELFVQKSELYHARKPGAMIHGMAWFEIMYLGRLYENRKVIERYLKHGPDNYENYKSSGVNFLPAKNKLKNDKEKLQSLIKMNSGRIKMREALGLSLKDDLETVLRRHWLLGDFLNNDKVKVKKAKVDPAVKKRSLLLSKYKTAIKKYKKKLTEEKSIN